MRSRHKRHSTGCVTRSLHRTVPSLSLWRNCLLLKGRQGNQRAAHARLVLGGRGNDRAIRHQTSQRPGIVVGQVSDHQPDPSPEPPHLDRDGWEPREDIPPPCRERMQDWSNDEQECGWHRTESARMCPAQQGDSVREWLWRRDRRDWLLFAVLLLSMRSCYQANAAYDLAASAEDQADAAQGEADRARSEAEQVQSDLEDTRNQLRLP